MNKLSLQQQALLELIKLGIGTSDGSFDFSRLSADDWTAVVDESHNQALGLLCFDATKDFSDLVSKNLYNEWFIRSAKTIAANMRVQSTQKWLTEMLEEHNIPYVILKGFSSASFYPNPDKRPLGDIDFITSPEHLDSVEDLLINNGCTKDENSGIIHYCYFKDGVELELHFEISGTPEGKSGEVVRSYLKGIVDSYVFDSCPDPFRRPTDELHGAVIFLHVLHHILSMGIGLRQICDWACFVNKTHNDSFWKKSLIPMLKEAGLFKFAAILTDATVRYLGIERPLWMPDIDDTLADDFMLEIFRAGNFGKKEKHLAGTAIMLTKDSGKQTLPRKIKAMFRALNSTNHRVYPILDKAPWLYPFIMLWRIIRYLCLSLVGKRQSLVKASRYADERNILLSKFELYKTEGE